MLISAQDQSLRTTKVHQENIRHLRKMYCHRAGRDEIVSHILQCSGLAVGCYKVWRHDNIAQEIHIQIHWKMCKNLIWGQQRNGRVII